MMEALVASASLGLVRDSVDGSSRLATKLSPRYCFHRLRARTVRQAIGLFRGCVAQVLEAVILAL